MDIPFIGPQDLQSPKPFERRLDLVASLSTLDFQVHDLRVLVQYPTGGGGQIRGLVIITSEELYSNMIRLFNTHSRSYCLKGLIIGNPSISVLSDTVRLRSLGTREYNDQPTPVQYGAAVLEFGDFSMMSKSECPLPQRRITFYAFGPINLWNCPYECKLADDGRIGFDLNTEAVDWGMDGLRTELCAKHIFEYEPAFRDTSNPEAAALTFIEVIAADDDSQFISKTESITKDLCQLTSFIARTWCDWYGYEFNSERNRVQYYRRVRRNISTETDSFKYLVDCFQGREFLSKALPSYRKYRADGFDLFMPLTYYMLAHESGFIESNFAVMFFGLERINKLFGGDRTKLRLRKLLDSLGVEWLDLYPKGDPSSLLKTRNDIFHSNRDVDIDLLACELVKLQSLLERIVLSKLGWADTSRAPDIHTRRWLTDSGRVAQT